jgi:hypothetical protein
MKSMLITDSTQTIVWRPTTSSSLARDNVSRRAHHPHQLVLRTQLSCRLDGPVLGLSESRIRPLGVTGKCQSIHVKDSTRRDNARYPQLRRISALRHPERRAP